MLKTLYEFCKPRGSDAPYGIWGAIAEQLGNTDLSVVTTTALANFFTALGKPELSNVCPVISDLRATYESGSELLQSSFRELENEVNRRIIVSQLYGGPAMTGSNAAENFDGFKTIE